MGCWDYYCAICGGPFTSLFLEAEEQQDPEHVYTYDPAVVQVDDPKMAWLRRFRVLCEAPFEGDDARYATQ